jgi:pyruvate dehydrogenase E2 component (dihydrolipoamide acetyltransferase)
MPTIKVPQAGKAVQSGTVRRWLKKTGDSVEKGDILVELDTEEGLLQVEAPLSGRLGQTLLAAGKTAPVHSSLAVIIEDSSAAAGNADTVLPETAGSTAPTQGPAGTVTPILMPKAGQSMEEGTLLKWRVSVGSTIKKGDVIFEIETDKATMEVEATDSGRLARIVLLEGEMLPVLQPVAYLADNDADVDAYIAMQGDAQQGTGDRGQGTGDGNDQSRRHPSSFAGTPANSAGVAPSPATAQDHATRALATASMSEGGRVKASPAARRLAAERSVDLSTISTGSGPRGRILSTDVAIGGAAAKRRRMSQMRKAIARNLLLSKQTIPHFYVRLTINAESLLAFYQSRKALYPCSINDVIVHAAARTIQEFPAFRSRIEGDEIVESASANIGIAVGLDEGLVVPVVLGAEGMNLQQIGATTRRLAESARAGKIEGMGQGCFTITNLGMFGTEEFAAIINPPEAAILAVGAIRQAAVVKDGVVQPGKVMTVTLSADHRVVDGMLAAKFLARLKGLLESPAEMV